MKKFLALLAATAALTLSAGAANAGNVQWSIGINLPPIGTVISNGPSYYPAPVYAPAPVYVPPPVYYRPPPVYYAPPVVYRPAPRYYYGPPAVVVDRRWDGPRGHWDRRGDDRGDNRWEGRRDDGRWGPGQRDERRFRH